ncbi:uncharacterized protein LOC134771976 [Penaeus indicus]|uniref:uncharacterized protein LOC134771976 n=1 Tax=Penaeus indicus TaxID=29960 RepID=UPI00300D219F
MPKTVIAALQIGTSPDGSAATVENILKYEPEILETGCKLTPEGQRRIPQVLEAGGDIPGPEVDSLCKLARRVKTFIVVGVVERGGSTLYCTALFISDQGEVVAKHRKVLPTASERLIWGRGDGSTLPLVKTPAGLAGAAICWENYMPLLRYAMYAKGIQIWCAPTVDERDIWQTSMKHISYEGRTFLVSACQYQPPPTEEMCAALGLPEGKPIIRGGSVIYSPMGEALAGPVYDREALLKAEIDLDDIIRARYDMDVVGHYARPDIFQLVVDEKPKNSMDCQ